jgi:transposase
MRYHHPSLHYRLRAEAILLNSRGFSVPKISQVIEYERKAICRWLDNWQKSGLVGLYDKPRSGRPSILNAQDVTLVEELVKEEPRQLKQALAKFEKITSVAKLVDALDLGSSGNPVRVRVSPLAPLIQNSYNGNHVTSPI